MVCRISSKIASKIQDEADPDANIIFGATVNEAW